MFLELLAIFFTALLVGVVLWALFGLLLMPVFCAEMVTLCFASGSGKRLEMRVRAYGWLRETRRNGGKLIIVDRGLTEDGLRCVQHLRVKRPWLGYCPSQTLTDYIDLLQHCLENDPDLV